MTNPPPLGDNSTPGEPVDPQPEPVSVAPPTGTDPGAPAEVTSTDEADTDATHPNVSSAAAEPLAAAAAPATPADVDATPVAHTVAPPVAPAAPAASAASAASAEASAAAASHPAPPAPPAPPASGTAAAGTVAGADQLSNIQVNYWLSVFFTWLPALIFFIIEKDKGQSLALRYHVANLNFSLLRTIVTVAIWIFSMLPYIGWLLGFVLGIGAAVLFVFHIIAAVKAGERYRAGQEPEFVLNVPLVK